MGLTKEQGKFCQLDPLRMILTETLMVLGLDRVIHWVFHKELKVGQ